MTPRIGTAAQFAALRQFLQEANYTEAAVCDWLEIPALSRAVHLRPGGPQHSTLDTLTRLFLLGESLPQGWIPANIVQLLHDLGLVYGESMVTATVKLYPVRSVYVISDRDRASGDGTDHVFSAVSPQTEEFLQMAPHTPCPSCLEICAGAGAAALLAASQYAIQAFAFDLSERCCAFAEFSRRLNGIGNLTVRRGDLYAPAAGRTFDRILAHPPYVPSLQSGELFRDGGADGEWLTRRIVEGLPVYLHPGGRLYLMAMFAEYADGSIPDRIRGWLHGAEGEFDLVVVYLRSLDARAFLFDNAAPEDLPAWRQLVEQRSLLRFHIAHVIVERHREPAEARTVVREAGEGYAIAHAERCLAQPGMRPRIAGGARCDQVLSSTGPFRAQKRLPDVAGDLLARCDGTRTSAELGQDELVTELISLGLLEAV